jgi:hypothetical protein
MTSPIAIKGLRASAAGVLGALAMVPACAQSGAQGLLDNSFVFNAGAFVMGTDIKASLNGQSVNNPEIDFDETFGTASDSTRGRVDALWRINPRHQLRFVYFNNSNSRTKVLDRDLAWGDNVYQIGAEVTSESKFTVYELAYEYAFMRSPSYEVAAIIGLHATDLSLTLSGTANILDANGNVSQAGFVTKTGEALAPLPVIGIRGGWVVAPQWYVDGQAQLFSLNSGPYGGRWSDVRVNVTWMFHRNFGVGLGYDRYQSRIDVEKSGFEGRVKLGYSGLQAFLTGTF